MRARRFFAAFFSIAPLLALPALFLFVGGAGAAGPSDGKIEAALAEAGDSQTRFSSCMAARERATQREEDAAPSPATVKACRNGCTMDAVLADAALKTRFFPDVVLRQVCRAQTLGSEAPCDALADVKGEPETGRHMCLRLYKMGLFSQTIVAGKVEDGACRDWCALAPTAPPAALVGKVCAALERRDYPEACAEIEHWKATPDNGYNRRECDWEMLSVLGEGSAEVCGHHYRPGSDICEATGLYKKAAAAGDPKLCGGLPMCRAYMGEGPSACAPLDAKILAEARGAVSAAPGATEGAHPDAADLPGLNLECGRARSVALRDLDAARRLLKSPSLAGHPRLADWRAQTEALDAERKDLESTFLLRSGAVSSHSVAALSSYAGGWLFFNTPKRLAGRCGVGPDDLDKEKSAGTINVDVGGRFLAFAGNASIAGEVDLVTGALSAVLTDPFCGEGPIAGKCSSFAHCSGTYSQSSGAGADGVVDSESGVFRLVR